MLQQLLTKFRKTGHSPAMVPMTPGQVASMVRMVAGTRPDELGCDECFDQLDRFAELHLAGKSAAEALPLVQDHLDRCGDCREEFELLLASLQADALPA